MDSNSQRYLKGDSFRSLSGSAVTTNLSTLVEQVEENFSSLTTYQQTIVERALHDLTDSSPETSNGPKFHLRPHVIDELSRLDAADIGRYLFHRYRYDVFPQTRELDDFPPCVQIEPSSICNLRCVFCFQTDKLLTSRAEGHMGQMPIERFRSVVDELVGNVEFVTLASRGEPLLAKGFEQMLEYSAGKFLGLKINTNATFLDERRAHAILQAEPNTVVFSADAADKETYATLRVNGDFDKVTANIERFDQIRSSHYPNSRTITRVSGVAYNEAQQNYEAVVRYWQNLVDQVAIVQYNPWENAYESPPNGITDPCSDLWRRMFVWWDGRVNPCDVDYRSFLSPGNVTSESIRDIWNGPGYEHLREQHESNLRQALTPCRGCVTV